MAKAEKELPLPEGARSLGRHTIVRVTIYYLAAAAFLLTITGMFPKQHMRLVESPPAGLAETLEWLRWRMAVLPGGAPRWLDACVQMLGALVLAIPIAFTYVRTRTRIKYDHSLIQTIVMLPIVVTAILVVVQDSLALAFSLAGIVAAVRFRNNLKESGDAVYIFGSIGIGFATGIHALAVAGALSFFFVVLELALWKFNFSGEFEDTFRRLCMPSGADLAGIPVSNSERQVATAGNGRKREEGLEVDPRAVVLRIYVHDLAAARPLIERVLERDAKQWAAAGSEPGDGVSGILDYRVRAKKSVGIETLRSHLLSEGAPQVIAADEALQAKSL